MLLRFFFAVNEGFAALVVGDDAPAQVAGGGKRLAVVGAQAVVAVAANACLEGGFAFVAVGVFAHEVDAGGRVACAGHQAGGAAHDFDAVVDAGVGEAFARDPRARPVHVHAIDLVFVDGEAARAEGVTASVHFADGDAGRAGQGFGEGGEVLVTHLLLGDDADGLRRFLRGERHAGGAAHGGYGVVARVFAGDTAFVGGDGDGREGGVVGGVGDADAGRAAEGEADGLW